MPDPNAWAETNPNDLDPSRRSRRVCLALAYFFMAMLFFFAWPSDNAPFIYFQF